MVATTFERNPEETKKLHNLGSLRLRNVDTNQVILIPTPSNDPNGK